MNPAISTSRVVRAPSLDRAGRSRREAGRCNSSDAAEAVGLVGAGCDEIDDLQRAARGFSRRIAAAGGEAAMREIAEQTPLEGLMSLL